MKNKVIDFTPINVEFMAKSLFQPIWNFDRGIKSRLAREYSATYRSLIVPTWPYWQFLNPHKLIKNDHR